VAGSFERRLELPLGCGDGSLCDAEQLGQDGLGDSQALAHDRDQGFLGEDQRGGVASSGPAGCRADAGDVPAGLELGLAGDGEGVGELIPGVGGHAGQGGCSQPGRSPRPGRGAGRRRDRGLGADGER
jgi:hypothetical protein